MICLSLRTRLYSQRLGVVGPVGPPGEVRQVELNLVPAVVQPHRHGADERLHSRCALIVTRPKPSPNVFIIQHLGDVNKCKQIAIIKPSVSTRQERCVKLTHTWTSNVKYFLRFLMIMTKNGSLMPRVFLGSAGHVI